MISLQSHEDALSELAHVRDVARRSSVAMQRDRWTLLERIKQLEDENAKLRTALSEATK